MTSTFTNNYSRTSENTLFSLLIAAFIGWVALSTVSGPTEFAPAVSNAVAQIASAGGNS